MKRVIVWFRGDLRVHDHPALAAACADADEVVPLFILDPHFLATKRGSNRNRFLRESLVDLDGSLRQLGGRLIVRSGTPENILPTIVTEVDATTVYYISDYTPYSIQRDKTLADTMAQRGVTFIGCSGKLVVSGGMKLVTKTGARYKVFTPFWKAWMGLPRRALVDIPQRVVVPDIPSDALPQLDDITSPEELSPDVVPGGETAGRARFEQFLRDDIAAYHQEQNDLSQDRTSHMSAYLHFGCVSPLELEQLLPDSKGARAWNRQLAWREFYYYILLHFPSTTQRAFQEQYANLRWSNDPELFEAWRTGRTGYPIVDAGMRQLRREGFMHNRARLIVGSFLTKDLWCDWRRGEQYFMTMLVDGDVANNVGNWQWIASVGVDPAPVYRRLYNPTLQAKKFDPSGAYIRRYVPELQHVPDKYIYEPWTMPEQIQHESSVVIGIDYPRPVVDHAEARRFALEQYRSQRDES